MNRGRLDFQKITIRIDGLIEIALAVVLKCSVELVSEGLGSGDRGEQEEAEEEVFHLAVFIAITHMKHITWITTAGQGQQTQIRTPTFTPETI